MMNWYFASGDLDFFWKEQLQALSWLPQVFRKDLGLGVSNLLSLWLDYPFRLVMKLFATLGFSWFFIEKILWIAVFALAVYSSYKLTKHVLGPVIYVANTYFLLLFAGGQLGVAFAYALAPLVLDKFMRKNPIANGLWMALLVVFDLRIAYLMAGAIILYLIVTNKLRDFGSFLVSLFIAVGVHLYWILPTILAGTAVSETIGTFTSPGMLKFLSFADFSHALTLLHPNWPENLFGKVYFLQPEYLVITILAFSSLLFITKKSENRLQIIFFAFLAFIGVFFAKGVNDPLGGVFQWMFTNIPGFVMFRDPTKFYLYIALGYSILIPFTLRQIKNKYVILLFIIFWIFTLRGFRIAVLPLPDEYVILKNMLVSDTTPSRTLWIPQKERFAFFSDIHPILVSPKILPFAYLQDAGVKYVIVPEDAAKRIFLSDYTFDPRMRDDIVASLSALPLTRLGQFKDIAVFKNDQFSMKTSVSKNIEKQQLFADIGVGLSAATLLVCAIAFRRRGKN